MKKLLIVSFAICCAAFQAHAENGKPIKKIILPVPESVEIIDSLPAPKPEFSVSNSFTNGYQWRGLTFNEGLMIQPSVSVSYGNWFANTWSNIVAFEAAGNAIVPEVDFTAGYVIERDNFTATPQANIFFFPSNCSDVATMELGAEMTYDLENVGFYLNPNFDIGYNDGGIYVDYGIYKAGRLNERWSYDTRFLLGWGNKLFCNFYAPAPVVETTTKPFPLKEETFKTMRIQASAEYNASDRLVFQPQLTAYRNFMTSYSVQQPSEIVRLNAAVTCSYAF